MIPSGKTTGKRTTVLVVLALVGGLGVIAGLVELGGALVPAPDRSVASDGAGEGSPPVVPQGARIDDHTVEIRAEGLDPGVLELALRAAKNAAELYDVRGDRLTIIDYSLPSTEKRLWVFDLETGEVLFHELVAHGKTSGENLAEAFSNEPGSLASSLGTYLTADTYQGKHGYSLKLEGLDPGLNDNAMERAVVVHGADYVSPEYAADHGRLGRSWGCPAVRVDVAEPLIDAIAGGSVLFVYYPDPELERASQLLRGN